MVLWVGRKLDVEGGERGRKGQNRAENQQRPKAGSGRQTSASTLSLRLPLDCVAEGRSRSVPEGRVLELGKSNESSCFWQRSRRRARELIALFAWKVSGGLDCPVEQSHTGTRDVVGGGGGTPQRYR